jgi:hypothetical protein
MLTGEYEQTIGRSWYRSSNFRAFLTKASCPPALQNCLEFFETLVGSQVRDTLATDALLFQDHTEDAELDDADDSHASHSQRLTQDIHALLIRRLPGRFIPTEVNFISHSRHHGILYSTNATHEGNSCVFLSGNHTPFCIEKILRFPNKGGGGLSPELAVEAWLIVRPHLGAGVTLDPYLAYPYLRARIWSVELGPPEAVRISQIDSHFAKCQIRWEDQDVVVAVSLSRVSAESSQA